MGRAFDLILTLVFMKLGDDLAHGISLQINSENVYADITKDVFAYFYSATSCKGIREWILTTVFFKKNQLQLPILYKVHNRLFIFSIFKADRGKGHSTVASSITEKQQHKVRAS